MATTSNRVGHPVRNRRRNRNIYNEDEETSFGPSNRISMMYATKSPATTTTSNSTSTTTTASASASYSSITSSDSKGKGKQLSSFGITSRGGSNHETSSISSSSSNSNSVTTAASSNNNSSGSPSKANRFNKHIGATLTTSLKTLLKLPKAHNWVNHEWFYGNIDQVLFLDENEFSICLRDSFPQLRTRHLTRAEWSQIRRLMGKPRRCSAAFFKEERNTLNTKRQKIRHLQQNKVGSLQAGGFKDLPENIPHPLVVGTNVAALARVCDSLYFGVIEGIDSTNGTYRVAFNRSDVGSLSIPDYEVAPISQPVMAPLASFEQKPRKVWQLANRFVENSEVHVPGAAGHQHLLHSHHHPQASHAHLQSHLLHHADQQHHLSQHHLHPQQRSGAMSAVQSSMQAYRAGGVIGHQLHQQQLHQLPDPLAVTPIPVPEAIINGFPAKFLVQLVKASRTLSQKRKKVADLKAVNTEIERMTSRSERVSFAFKRSYALSILDLEKINKEVSRHLAAIQSYSLQVASERQLKSLKPDVVSQKCLLESKALVEKLQANKSVRVGCDRTKSLIVNLMSLMFHLRGFRDSEVSCYEFQSIFETIAAIRRQVSHCNVENFQNNVEIHIRHILSSVSHLGNVGVFSESANGGAGGNGGSNGTASSSLAGGETVNIKMEA